MSAAIVDRSRRQFLINSTGAIATIGVATTAVPFLKYWQPTAASQLDNAPARIDVSKLSVGEGVKFLWRGLPMWVVRRSEAALTQLSTLRDRLKDPDSLESTQPDYVRNTNRARRPDVMVLTAVCTHLQCIPELKGRDSGLLDADLEGGFYCACHGSRFDVAGRVLKGSPAPMNLSVPEYYFEDDIDLVIGVNAPPES